MSMNTLLKCENLTFSFDGHFEIDRATFGLKQEDFTLFFGPNGAGKTTLFKLMVGLLKPDSGNILLKGKDLRRWPTIEFAKEVAYLEQEVQYLFPFTVEEIVLMGRFAHSAGQYWDRKQDLEVAVWAMETVGVLKFAKRSIFQLSGGERRKVEIARALCQKPKLMLMDEPATFLDLRQRVELFEILAQLNRQEGITIGLISHQIDLAKDYVKSAIGMKCGRIVSDGPAKTVLTKEKLKELFELMPRSLRSSDIS